MSDNNVRASLSARALWLGLALAIGLLLAMAVVAFGKASGTPAKDRSPTAHPGPRALLSDRFDVFSRRRTPADQVSAAAATRAAQIAASAPDPGVSVGELQFERSRLILERGGNAPFRLHVVPTSENEVCLIVNDEFDGCAGAANFSTAPIDFVQTDPDRVGAGAPIVFYGLALDGVDSVSVIDNEAVSNAAVVHNNAFFGRLANTRSWPVRAVVGFTDGSSQTVPLPGGPPPGSPASPSSQP
jgi:hypothetical protein